MLDGHSDQTADVLGAKAFGINAIRRIGLPVAPAFCLTTAVCARWFSDSAATIDEIWPDIRAGMCWLESETSRTFGAGPHPLLVSVLSGAAQSMPGMLDTELNLGIDDSVEKSLAKEFSPRFAADVRDRFCRMYRTIVLADESGPIPDDPERQLREAIEAVFRSWRKERAVTYRRHRGLDDIAGTGVVVQATVFGNYDTDSGTGVLFSRDPRTGAETPFGEWLRCGQGENVVSGTTDVEPISALAERLPDVHPELIRAARQLERLHTGFQDIEFTVERGKLWLLQTRAAKRSAHAAVLVSGLEVKCDRRSAKIAMYCPERTAPSARQGSRLAISAAELVVLRILGGSDHRGPRLA